MTRVAVIGASGYTGQELVRLLVTHPEFELVGLFGSERGAGRDAGVRTIAEVASSLAGVCDLDIAPASVEAITASDAQVVFLATPHEVSIELGAQLRESAPDVVVVDLSAGFRLRDAQLYPEWYGFEHHAPELLAAASFGLPEVEHVFGRTGVQAGDALIACAGCYVTAASVAIAPVVAAGLVRVGTRPIIDAISGVSGAGKKAQAHTSFCEVSATPYGVGTHRHRPEIAQTLELGVHDVVFQPVIGPWHRGILATCHVELNEGVSQRDVADAFGAYESEPFVRTLGDVGAGARLPSVGAVERTNFVDIAWSLETTPNSAHLAIFSTLDNLVKGASGQAVQCANAAVGLPETLGLLPGAGKVVDA